MSQPALLKVRDADTNQVWTLDLSNNTRTMTDESGRLITMDLGQTDVHIDAALANYAAGYRQWDGIADLVAPLVPSDKASNKYYTWDKDDIFQQVDDLVVGPNAQVMEISPRLSSSSFTTVGYGASAAVATELSANADSPLQVEQAAMRRCLNAVNLGREVRVATLALTSTNWTGGYTTTLGATAKWNGGSASNPIQDIMTAVEGSLTPVSHIALSERTWHDFFQNAAVQKYVASKIDAPPLGTINAGDQLRIAGDKLSALLGLPPFLIGRQKKKTSGGYGYVWGDHVALLHVEPGVPSDGQSISTFKTFRWTGANSGAPDGTVQGGFLVRSYFDPRRGARGSKLVVVTHNDAEVSTSVYAGGLIINAHQ
jgi:hypothetical protein